MMRNREIGSYESDNDGDPDRQIQENARQAAAEFASITPTALRIDSISPLKSVNNVHQLHDHSYPRTLATHVSSDSRRVNKNNVNNTGQKKIDLSNSNEKRESVHTPSNSSYTNNILPGDRQILVNAITNVLDGRRRDEPSSFPSFDSSYSLTKNNASQVLSDANNSESDNESYNQQNLNDDFEDNVTDKQDSCHINNFDTHSSCDNETMTDNNVSATNDNVNSNGVDHCINCQNLRNEFEEWKKEMLANFQIMKLKVMSTDELISEHHNNFANLESQKKVVNNLKSKLDTCYGETGALRIQLKKALQANEPLKKTVRRFEYEKVMKQQTIDELKGELDKAEFTIMQLKDASSSSRCLQDEYKKTIDYNLKEHERDKKKIIQQAKMIDRLNKSLTAVKTKQRDESRALKKALKDNEKLLSKNITHQSKAMKKNLNLKNISPGKASKKSPIGVLSPSPSPPPTSVPSRRKSSRRKRKRSSNNSHKENFFNNSQLDSEKTSSNSENDDDIDMDEYFNKSNKKPLTNYSIPTLLSPPLSPIPPSPVLDFSPELGSEIIPNNTVIFEPDDIDGGMSLSQSSYDDSNVIEKSTEKKNLIDDSVKISSMGSLPLELTNSDNIKTKRKRFGKEKKKSTRSIHSSDKSESQENIESCVAKGSSNLDEHDEQTYEASNANEIGVTNDLNSTPNDNPELPSKIDISSVSNDNSSLKKVLSDLDENDMSNNDSEYSSSTHVPLDNEQISHNLSPSSSAVNHEISAVMNNKDIDKDDVEPSTLSDSSSVVKNNSQLINNSEHSRENKTSEVEISSVMKESGSGNYSLNSISSPACSLAVNESCQDRPSNKKKNDNIEDSCSVQNDLSDNNDVDKTNEVVGVSSHGTDVNQSSIVDEHKLSLDLCSQNSKSDKELNKNNFDIDSANVNCSPEFNVESMSDKKFSNKSNSGDNISSSPETSDGKKNVVITEKDVGSLDCNVDSDFVRDDLDNGCTTINDPQNVSNCCSPSSSFNTEDRTESQTISLQSSSPLIPCTSGSIIIQDGRADHATSSSVCFADDTSNDIITSTICQREQIDELPDSNNTQIVSSRSSNIDELDSEVASFQLPVQSSMDTDESSNQSIEDLPVSSSTAHQHHNIDTSEFQLSSQGLSPIDIDESSLQSVDDLPQSSSTVHGDESMSGFPDNSSDRANEPNDSSITSSQTTSTSSCNCPSSTTSHSILWSHPARARHVFGRRHSTFTSGVTTIPTFISSRLRVERTRSLSPTMFSPPSPPLSPIPPSPRRSILTPIISPLPTTPLPESISPLPPSPKITSPPLIRGSALLHTDNPFIFVPKPVSHGTSTAVKVLKFTAENHNNKEKDCSPAHKSDPFRARARSCSPSLQSKAQFDSIQHKDSSIIPTENPAPSNPVFPSPCNLYKSNTQVPCYPYKSEENSPAELLSSCSSSNSELVSSGESKKDNEKDTLSDKKYETTTTNWSQTKKTPSSCEVSVTQQGDACELITKPSIQSSSGHESKNSIEQRIKSLKHSSNNMSMRRNINMSVDSNNPDFNAKRLGNYMELDLKKKTSVTYSSSTITRPVSNDEKEPALINFQQSSSAFVSKESNLTVDSKLSSSINVSSTNVWRRLDNKNEILSKSKPCKSKDADDSSDDDCLHIASEDCASQESDHLTSSSDDVAKAAWQKLKNCKSTNVECEKNKNKKSRKRIASNSSEDCLNKTSDNCSSKEMKRSYESLPKDVTNKTTENTLDESISNSVLFPENVDQLMKSSETFKKQKIDSVMDSENTKKMSVHKSKEVICKSENNLVNDDLKKDKNDMNFEEGEIYNDDMSGEIELEDNVVESCKISSVKGSKSSHDKQTSNEVICKTENILVNDDLKKDSSIEIAPFKVKDKNMNFAEGEICNDNNVTKSCPFFKNTKSSHVKQTSNEVIFKSEYNAVNNDLIRDLSIEIAPVKDKNDSDVEEGEICNDNMPCQKELEDNVTESFTSFKNSKSSHVKQTSNEVIFKSEYNVVNDDLIRDLSIEIAPVKDKNDSDVEEGEICNDNMPCQKELEDNVTESFTSFKNSKSSHVIQTSNEVIFKSENNAVNDDLIRDLSIEIAPVKDKNDIDFEEGEICNDDMPGEKELEDNVAESCTFFKNSKSSHVKQNSKHQPRIVTRDPKTSKSVFIKRLFQAIKLKSIQKSYVILALRKTENCSTLHQLSHGLITSVKNCEETLLPKILDSLVNGCSCSLPFTNCLKCGKSNSSHHIFKQQREIFYKCHPQVQYISTPVLTSFEKDILAIIFAVLKVKNFPGAVMTLLDDIQAEIHTDKDLLSCERLALCRVFAGICRFYKKTNRLIGFIYSLAYDNLPYISFPAIFITCYSVWPSIVSRTNLIVEDSESRLNFSRVKMSPLSSTLQFIALTESFVRQEPVCQKILQKILTLSWSNEFSLHDNYKKLIEELCLLLTLKELSFCQQNGDDRLEVCPFAISTIKAIEILCKRVGWEWTYNFVFSEKVFKYIKGFFGEGNNFHPDTVGIFIRLSGDLCRYGMNVKVELKSFCQLLVSLLEKIMNSDIEVNQIEISIIYTLLVMAPYYVDICYSTLKNWLAKTSSRKIAVPQELYSIISDIFV